MTSAKFIAHHGRSTTESKIRRELDAIDRDGVRSVPSLAPARNPSETSFAPRLSAPSVCCGRAITKSAPAIISEAAARPATVSIWRRCTNPRHSAPSPISEIAASSHGRPSVCSCSWLRPRRAGAIAWPSRSKENAHWNASSTALSA